MCLQHIKNVNMQVMTLTKEGVDLALCPGLEQEGMNFKVVLTREASIVVQRRTWIVCPESIYKRHLRINFFSESKKYIHRKNSETNTHGLNFWSSISSVSIANNDRVFPLIVLPLATTIMTGVPPLCITLIRK